MKLLPRPILIFVFCIGLAMALWPVGQMGYGWWVQHKLESNWNDAVAQYRAEHPHARARRVSAKHVKCAPVSVAVHRVGARYTAKPRAAAQHPAPLPQVASYLDVASSLPPTRLVIPSIGLDAIVGEGVDSSALSQGPGHDPISALPGESGNCVIAGHRNMYGWWFYKLDRLGAGSIIQLRSPLGIFTYKVATSRVVRDSDLEVLAPPPPGAAPRLTLYTCALPHGSKRIVVAANLVDQKPL